MIHVQPCIVVSAVSEIFQDILMRADSYALRSYFSRQECTRKILSLCFEKPMAIIRSDKSASSSNSSKVTRSADEILSQHNVLSIYYLVFPMLHSCFVSCAGNISMMDADSTIVIPWEVFWQINELLRVAQIWDKVQLHVYVSPFSYLSSGVNSGDLCLTEEQLSDVCARQCITQAIRYGGLHMLIYFSFPFMFC